MFLKTMLKYCLRNVFTSLLIRIIENLLLWTDLKVEKHWYRFSAAILGLWKLINKFQIAMWTNKNLIAKFSIFSTLTGKNKIKVYLKASFCSQAKLLSSKCNKIISEKAKEFTWQLLISPGHWFSTMLSRHICVSRVSSGVSPNNSKP